MTVAADTPFAAAIAILEASYYTPSELAKWLQSPHPQLGGETPLTILALGRASEILAVVLRLDEGVYL